MVINRTPSRSGGDMDSSLLTAFQAQLDRLDIIKDGISSIRMEMGKGAASHSALPQDISADIKYIKELLISQGKRMDMLENELGRILRCIKEMRSFVPSATAETMPEMETHVVERKAVLESSAGPRLFHSEIFDMFSDRFGDSGFTFLEADMLRPEISKRLDIPFSQSMMALLESLSILGKLGTINEQDGKFSLSTRYMEEEPVSQVPQEEMATETELELEEAGEPEAQIKDDKLPSKKDINIETEEGEQGVDLDIEEPSSKKTEPMKMEASPIVTLKKPETQIRSQETENSDDLTLDIAPVEEPESIAPKNEILIKKTAPAKPIEKKPIIEKTAPVEPAVKPPKPVEPQPHVSEHPQKEDLKLSKEGNALMELINRKFTEGEFMRDILLRFSIEYAQDLSLDFGKARSIMDKTLTELENAGAVSRKGDSFKILIK